MDKAMTARERLRRMEERRLVHPYPELRRESDAIREADSIHTPLDRLRQIAENSTSPVRAAVADSYFTPPVFLSRMALSEREITPIRDLASEILNDPIRIRNNWIALYFSIRDDQDKE